MGNHPACNQCEIPQQFTPSEYSIQSIRLPYDPILAPQMISFIDQEDPFDDPFNSKIISKKHTISKIVPKCKKTSKLSILDMDLLPSLSVQMDLQNNKRTLKQSHDQKQGYSMVCIESANPRTESTLNLIFIDISATKQMFVVAFAGIQKDNQKQKGLHFLFKPNEFVLFNGVFSGNKNLGVKITKRQDFFQRHWGEFNSKFETEGKGTAISYSKHEQKDQEHYFQGQFAKGKRQGKGTLNLKFNSKKDPQLSQNEKVFFSPYLTQIQAQLLPQSRHDIQKLTHTIVDFITKLSPYKPGQPQLQPSTYYDIVVSSTWKNDQAEGFTEEYWPNKNVRFEGMYKNNQRNGYGEQYAYDQIVAKGFYKDGVMQTDKDNEYLLMGLKLVDEQWVRSKNLEKEQQWAH